MIPNLVLPNKNSPAKLQTSKHHFI